MLLALLIGISGCDYTIPLDDGYRLVRVSSDRFVLAAPEGPSSKVLAGPTVVGYRELPSVIVGRVVAPVTDSGDSFREGYFIVDKKDHQLRTGLSRREWEEQLALIGVETPLGLKRPNRLQAWF